MRTLGFVSSLILTIAAYLIIIAPQTFYLGNNQAVWVIFSFAVLQALVQLICFIDLWKEDGPPWNLGVFVSTISIVLIIVIFSIWIMHYLDYNMMPWMHK